MNNLKVVVIGVGYVGLTFSVKMADLGCKVYGIDTNSDLVKSLNRGNPQFYEEGLKKMLKSSLSSGNLSFHEKIPSLGSNTVFVITVGTPLQISEKKPSEDNLIAALTSIGNVLETDSLVILRSTVPVGFTRNTAVKVLENSSNLVSNDDFNVVFAPERTIEGRALSELSTNPQILGSPNPDGLRKATELFNILGCEIVKLPNSESAEMVKLIDNSYRDVIFAYSNEIALISQHFSLDSSELIKAANYKYERNNIPLPSPGVGGACLSKDPYILNFSSRNAGFDPVMIKSSRILNEQLPKQIFERVSKLIYSEFGNNAKILVCGLAFKGEPPTSDLRDSPAVEIYKFFVSSFDNTLAFDPVIDSSTLAQNDISPSCDDFYSSCNDLDCLVILNNHSFFKEIDFGIVQEKASKNLIIFDGWGLVSQKVAGISNYTYLRM